MSSAKQASVEAWACMPMNIFVLLNGRVPLPATESSAILSPGFAGGRLRASKDNPGDAPSSHGKDWFR